MPGLIEASEIGKPSKIAMDTVKEVISSQNMRANMMEKLYLLERNR